MAKKKSTSQSDSDSDGVYTSSDNSQLSEDENIASRVSKRHKVNESSLKSTLSKHHKKVTKLLKKGFESIENLPQVNKRLDGLEKDFSTQVNNKLDEMSTTLEKCHDYLKSSKMTDGIVRQSIYTSQSKITIQEQKKSLFQYRLFSMILLSLVLFSIIFPELYHDTIQSFFSDINLNTRRYNPWRHSNSGAV